MATALAPLDVVTVRTWCADTDQAAVNTFHYLVLTAGVAPTTDAQMGDALDTLLAPLYKLCLNNHATYRGVYLQIRRSGQIFAGTISNGHIGAGTGGTDALPRQVCGLATFQTALAGVRFRGRMYIPFPSTAADTGDGIPTGGYQVDIFNIGAVYQGFTGPIAAGGSTWAPVLIHSPGVSAVPLPTDIISSFADGLWATQRRRGSFGRQNRAPF